MNIEESLKKQAIEISEILKIYIEIDDSISKKTGTFLSLFKRVDFEGIYNQTENLLSHLNKKKYELIELKSNFDEAVPKEYRQYFLQLYTFFERLYEAVVLLNDRQYQLFLKSKGEKYSYKDFIEIENKYKKAIEIYMEEGGKLERINYIIFN